MNLGRFWGVFFSMIAVGHIAQIIFIIKGTHVKRTYNVTKLVLGSLPIFLFMMWNSGELSLSAKIINTFIGFVSLAAGIAYLKVSKRKNNDK